MIPTLPRTRHGTPNQFPHVPRSRRLKEADRCPSCSPRLTHFLFLPVLLVSLAAHALTITSGPTFTPSTNAPLAGVLQISTDVPCRVSVSVTDGTNSWQRDFLDYTNAHSTPLYGFKPARTHSITVTVRDVYRNAIKASNSVTFVTAPVPSTLPPVVLITNQPSKMQPGYTLLKADIPGSPSWAMIVDNSGQLVWYGATNFILQDLRQLANGNLFLPLHTNFSEVNLLGQRVNTWATAAGLTLDNHDGVPTGHGTILYLSDQSRLVTNFPTSSTISNAPTATTNVSYQTVVEISATNSSLLSTWSTIDMLDPRRISYLTFTSRNALGWDWGHANAVLEDPRDNSIIVSLRHQNAVIKFARDTGRLKWILGPPENWGPQFQPYLLIPVGTPFAWNYAQHAPEITPQGTLLMFDNGNYRASPFDAWVADASNYSRAVEFSVDETNMTVSQVWQYASAEVIYSDSVGDANFMTAHDTVLLTYGNTSYLGGVHPSPYSPSAEMIRIREVTHDPVPEVVFDLALWDFNNTSPNYHGTSGYRAVRIPDLYSVLPQPVTDLLITLDHEQTHLQFSGDAAHHTYTVQASDNLIDWADLGQAVPSANASFDFHDSDSPSYPTRCYRVVTN